MADLGNFKSKERSIEELKQIFSPIPFRVVLEILSFCRFSGFNTLRRSISQYDLYGIFKKDRSRKVFFLCPSLNLRLKSDHEIKKSIFMDIQKIIYLNLDVSSENDLFIQRLTKKSVHFVRLRVLHLKIHGEIFPSFPRFFEIFSMNNTDVFPSLRKLEIHDYTTILRTTGSFDTSSWVEGPNVIITNLESLVLTAVPDTMKFDGLKSFPKLRNFEYNIRRGVDNDNDDDDDDDGDELIVLDLPVIENFVINSDNQSFEYFNLRFTNEGKTLRKFRIENLNLSDFRNFIHLQKHLNNFEYSYTPYRNPVSLDVLYSRENIVYDFQELELLSLHGIEISTDQTENFANFFSKLKKLKILRLSRFLGVSLYTFLRSHDFIHLEELRLYYVTFCVRSTSPYFPFCKRLKKLELDFLIETEEDTFNEDFFRVNEWDCLKSLKISALTITGKGWKPMPQLDMLCLMRTKSIRGYDKETLMVITDDFFTGRNFPSLTRLNLQNLVYVTGRRWDPDLCANLTDLRINGCTGIGDSFFQENKFSQLEMLLFSFMRYGVSDPQPGSKENVMELKGRGWKSMENLKYLRMEKCEFFEDCLFMEDEDRFPDLRYLFILFCESIKGKKGWKFLKQLEGMSVKVKTNNLDDVDMEEYFGDEFWENPPFRDDKKMLKRENVLLFED